MITQSLRRKTGLSWCKAFQCCFFTLLKRSMIIFEIVPFLSTYHKNLVIFSEIVLIFVVILNYGKNSYHILKCLFYSKSLEIGIFFGAKF